MSTTHSCRFCEVTKYFNLRHLCPKCAIPCQQCSDFRKNNFTQDSDIAALDFKNVLWCLMHMPQAFGIYIGFRYSKLDFLVYFWRGLHKHFMLLPIHQSLPLGFFYYLFPYLLMFLLTQFTFCDPVSSHECLTSTCSFPNSMHYVEIIPSHDFVRTSCLFPRTQN